MSSKRAQPAKPKPSLGIVTGSHDALSLPSHILRQTAVPVDFEAVSRSERWDLVRGLFAAMHAGTVGVGLAAPMTGVALRVVVIAVDNEPLAMFNPRIVETTGPQSEAVEANLSLPGVSASISRPHGVTVTWQSVNSGQERTATFEGRPARVVQHEMEILDGKLFIDHVSDGKEAPVRSEEERARDATAGWFGDSVVELPPAENFGMALLPPPLHDLDTVLTRPAAPVERELFGADRLRPIVTGMMKTLYLQRGVGLAAPQVGLSLRMTVIDSGEDKPLALINPTIIDRAEKEESGPEGCLSIPGWRGEVSRSTAIKVRSNTIDGETTDYEFSDYFARIVQHELDHLDGVLFTDRMDPEAQLEVTNGEIAADELTAKLQRFETQASRRPAERAKTGKSSPAKQRKRRRR